MPFKCFLEELKSNDNLLFSSPYCIVLMNQISDLYQGMFDTCTSFLLYSRDIDASQWSNKKIPPVIASEKEAYVSTVHGNFPTWQQNPLPPP